MAKCICKGFYQPVSRPVHEAESMRSPAKNGFISVRKMRTGDYSKGEFLMLRDVLCISHEEIDGDIKHG